MIIQRPFGNNKVQQIAAEYAEALGELLSRREMDAYRTDAPMAAGAGVEKFWSQG